MAPLSVDFRGITMHDIDQLREINSTSLPVRYSKKFYREILRSADNQRVSRFACFKGRVVGAVCGRIEEGDSEKRMYIVSLAVLAAFRGRGVGTQLLEKSLKEMKEGAIECCKVLLHVHVANVDAIRFYAERFGFEKVRMIENYYQRIENPHCYLLEKPVQN